MGLLSKKARRSRRVAEPELAPIRSLVNEASRPGLEPSSVPAPRLISSERSKVPVPTCDVSAQRQHSRGGTVAGSRTGTRGRPGAFGRDALSLSIKTPDVWDVRRTL